MASPSAFGALAAACTIPTCLGYWKQEYSVSYGYALAMALSGAAALAGGGLPCLGAVHAGALLVYGVRLGAFLLWRELTIERFKKFTESIEGKAPNRLKRTPWVAMCSLLYLGMASPLVLTARYITSAGPAATTVAQASLAAAFLGWGVAALGDLQKSFYKAKAPEAWVEGGLFSLLRHPNYQGEQLLWAGSCVAGLAAAWGARALTSAWPWVVGSLLGTLGIQYVLMMATTGLERRQGESYGSDESFAAYKARTWGGFTLPSKGYDA